MTTLLVVDDHAIVRRGLMAILDRERDLEVIGEAGTVDEGHAAVVDLQPDVVLLDLRLGTDGESAGLELCERIVASHPAAKVLVLSTFVDTGLVVEAVRRGARGYVVKDVDTSDLIRAIRSVAAGERAFDSRAAAAMANGIGTPGHSVLEELSDREHEVLALLVQGRPNKEIAVRLYISVTTVKFHVSNILRKLGVNRRAEVAYAAARRGVSVRTPR